MQINLLVIPKIQIEVLNIFEVVTPLAFLHYQLLNIPAVADLQIKGRLIINTIM